MFFAKLFITAILGFELYCASNILRLFYSFNPTVPQAVVVTLIYSVVIPYVLFRLALEVWESEIGKIKSRFKKGDK